MNKPDWTSQHQFRLAGRKVVYRINHEHLRGKPIGPGTNRVLCVGDSYTFGWLLDEEATYVRQLHKLANGDFPEGTFEFLNGASGGWGTANYVSFIEDHAAHLEPSVVLVFLNSDDVARSVKSGLYALNPDQTNKLVTVIPQVAGSEVRNWFRNFPAYQWTLQHSHLSQLARLTARKALERADKPVTLSLAQQSPEQLEADLLLEMALFLRLKSWCVQHHCKLLVLTPGFDAFLECPLGRENAANAAFLSRADAFFKSNDISFHALGPEIFAAAKGDYPSLSIPHNHHPNERGATMIATLSWSWMRSQITSLTNIMPQIISTESRKGL